MPTPGLCSSLCIDVSQEKRWKCRRKKKEEIVEEPVKKENEVVEVKRLNDTDLKRQEELEEALH